MQLSFCLAVLFFSDWSIPYADYIRVTDTMTSPVNSLFRLFGLVILLVISSELVPNVGAETSYYYSDESYSSSSSSETGVTISPSEEMTFKYEMT